MATHSSILAWEIPWIEDRGGLQSMGLQRVGHDSATKTTAFDLIGLGSGQGFTPLSRPSNVQPEQRNTGGHLGLPSIGHITNHWVQEGAIKTCVFNMERRKI